MFPPQVVIVPIVKKDTDRAEVNEAVDKLTAALKAAGIRTKVGTAFVCLGQAAKPIAEAVHIFTERLHVQAQQHMHTPARPHFLCCMHMHAISTYDIGFALPLDGVQPGRGLCSTMRNAASSRRYGIQLQRASIHAYQAHHV
jgi:uncharacterized protein YqgV (UPF0045/DUF77 family)